MHAHGISIHPPAGWEARITRRDGAGPVLHVATFPLLASDGDFGASATGRMRGDDAFAALVTYHEEAGIALRTGLFEATEQPSPQAAEFAPAQLQITRRGQLGWQRFFTAGDRARCLYAVIAPQRRATSALVADLRDVLATISFSSAP